MGEVGAGGVASRRPIQGEIVKVCWSAQNGHHRDTLAASIGQANEVANPVAPVSKESVEYTHRVA